MTTLNSVLWRHLAIKVANVWIMVPVFYGLVCSQHQYNVQNDAVHDFVECRFTTKQ